MLKVVALDEEGGWRSGRQPARRVRDEVARRGFLGMLGGFVGGVSGCGRGERLWRWQGTAFGTEVSILFEPPDRGRAEGLSRRCGEEVRRLESIFTLYQGDSPLRTLNERGVLPQPPMELVEALEICHTLHEVTRGVFDVTVQPLWEVYQAHFQDHPEDQEGPPLEALAAARDRVGFGLVSFSAERIEFQRSGMELTLNGMAQGFVTDRVASLLAGEGVEHALIDIGEYRALGAHPDGEPWRIAIRGESDVIHDILPLQDRGLATSSGGGWRFDGQGNFHHLFHPDRDEFRSVREVLTVVAPTAAMADGLATAGLVMAPEDWERTVAETGMPVRFWRYE